MDKLDIRPARRADLASVLKLYAQPALDDENVLAVDDAARILERFADYPDYVLYVAIREARVVGTFALLIMDNLAHCGAASAIIEDVAVDPDLHGRGIGTSMMRFAFQTARAKNCYKISLSSNAKREAAHEFYTTLGFQRHGYSFLLRLDEVMG